MTKWKKASLKEPLFTLPKGKIVFVIRTTVPHTSIGTTYWVMSGSVVYHVAESYGGSKLNRILTYIGSANDQEHLSEKANRLLKPFRSHIRNKGKK